MASSKHLERSQSFLLMACELAWRLILQVQRNFQMTATSTLQASEIQYPEGVIQLSFFRFCDLQLNSSSRGHDTFFWTLHAASCVLPPLSSFSLSLPPSLSLFLSLSYTHTEEKERKEERERDRNRERERREEREKRERREKEIGLSC